MTEENQELRRDRSLLRFELTGCNSDALPAVTLSLAVSSQACGLVK